MPGQWLNRWILVDEVAPRNRAHTTSILTMSMEEARLVTAT